jgi:DNA-binding response OmpR family regulator
MTTILIVEDDENVIDMLRTHLVSEGYRVVSASDGAQALVTVSSLQIDLALLDITLELDDGRDVFRELRLVSDVPIIFLTGRSGESDRIDGLKMGADDYIVKPLSLGEISARIESVLRRTNSNLRHLEIERPTIRFGDLSINENTHEVHVAGELVTLTSKEFALLAFMASTPRQVFSRRQLIESVWSTSKERPSEAIVNEVIRRIRAKIELDSEHPLRIITVRGAGYRFDPVHSIT